MNEWDDPRRTRNLEHGTNREIPPEEFAAYKWYNVTSIRDPPDVHVWIRMWDEPKDSER